MMIHVCLLLLLFSFSEAFPERNVNVPDCSEVTIFITTDSNPQDIGWEIPDSVPLVSIAAGTYTESNTEYSHTLCLMPTASFTLKATDATGDGWSTGSFRVTSLGINLVSSATVTGSEATEQFNVPQRNVDTARCSKVTVFITTDATPLDIGWGIDNTVPPVAAPAGTYTESNTVYNQTVCLDPYSSFRFKATDATGDGWSTGGYRIFSLGVDIVEFNTVDGSQASANINVPERNVDVVGCFNVTFAITTDASPQDIGWELQFSYPRLSWAAGSYTQSNTEYTHTACLATKVEFSFWAIDAAGNGWTTGGFRVFTAGLELVSPTEVFDSEAFGNFQLPEQNVDVDFCSNITVFITTDASPQDIGWTLDNTFPVVSVAAGTYTQSDTEYSKTVCVAEYTTVSFRATDAAGDGWSTGGFRVVSFGAEVAPLTSVSGASTTFDFDVPQQNVNTEGCTNTTIIITTDSSPSLISWEFPYSYPRVSVAAGTYTQSNTEYSLSVCLRANAYLQLVVTDTSSDGWTSSGQVRVFCFGVLVADATPTGDVQTSVDFQVPEKTRDVPGCLPMTVVITADSKPQDIGLRVTEVYPPLIIPTGTFTEGDRDYDVNLCLKPFTDFIITGEDASGDGWPGFKVMSYGVLIYVFTPVTGSQKSISTFVPNPPVASDSPSPASPSPSPIEPWTTIFRCNGASSTNRLLYSADGIKQLAATATQIRICTAGDSNDCVVSKVDSFPIHMLRLGKSISHNSGAPCNLACVQQAWTGSRLTNLVALKGWGSGAGLSGDVPLFWASGNFKGLHMSVKDRGYCGWSFGTNVNLEVALNTVAMSPLPSPAAVTWTRIMKCNGASSVGRLDRDIATIKQLATLATRIKICTAGNSNDCVVSFPNTFPIRMLRLGNTISHNAGVSCSADCIKATWSGERLNNLWSQGGNPVAAEGGLTGQEFFFWGTRNFQGLHLSVKNGGLCGWTYQANSNIEVFVDSA